MMKETLISLRKGLHFVLLCSLAVIIAGCANAQPLEGPVTADHIPEGPGLFTGEEGKLRFSIGEDGIKREKSNNSRTYSEDEGPARGQVYGQDEGQM